MSAAKYVMYTTALRPYSFVPSPRCPRMHLQIISDAAASGKVATYPSLADIQGHVFDQPVVVLAQASTRTPSTCRLSARALL